MPGVPVIWFIPPACLLRPLTTSRCTKSSWAEGCQGPEQGPKARLRVQHAASRNSSVYSSDRCRAMRKRTGRPGSGMHPHLMAHPTSRVCRRIRRPGGTRALRPQRPHRNLDVSRDAAQCKRTVPTDSFGHSSCNAGTDRTRGLAPGLQSGSHSAKRRRSWERAADALLKVLSHWPALASALDPAPACTIQLDVCRGKAKQPIGHEDHELAPHAGPCLGSRPGSPFAGHDPALVVKLGSCTKQQWLSMGPARSQRILPQQKHLSCPPLQFRPPEPGPHAGRYSLLQPLSFSPGGQHVPQALQKPGPGPRRRLYCSQPNSQAQTT